MEEAELHVGESSRVDTLDHLPLAAAFGHQLKLMETIDELCPPHPSHAVTHAQCIFAMVLSILRGHYPLYALAHWLEGVARDLLFGEELEAARFHDTRLAAALDAIYEGGLLKLFSTILWSLQGPSARSQAAHLWAGSQRRWRCASVGSAP
jgi:uncharacterized protein DUF4277